MRSRLYPLLISIIIFTIHIDKLYWNRFLQIMNGYDEIQNDLWAQNFVWKLKDLKSNI